MIGKKYGRWTVLSKAFGKGNKKRVFCICDCGSKKEVNYQNIKNGKTKSCGCLFREIAAKRKLSHGKTGTQIHSKWLSMKARCRCKKSTSYKRYGKKGIKVCKRWDRFENFYKDMSDSYYKHLKTHGKKNTTLDRIDNNKGYCKENCRWATIKQQARNKKTNILIKHNGTTKTLTEWSIDFGFNYGMANKKLKEGFSFEEVLLLLHRK